MRDARLHSGARDRLTAFRRLGTALATTLALGACHTYGSVRPAAIPLGQGAPMVRLQLAQPVSVTGLVTDRRTLQPEPRNVTLPAATGLSGRVLWAGADSLDIEVRGAKEGADWREFNWAPTMRIAWKDVAAAEAPKIAPVRTVATVGVLAGVGLMLALAIAMSGMGGPCC